MLDIKAIFKKKKSPNEIELERLYAHLAGMDPTTPEYAKVLTYIGRLTEYQNDTRPDKVKKDVWVQATSHILGVGIITGAEAFGSRIISKNGLNLLQKPKL